MNMNKHCCNRKLSLKKKQSNKFICTECFVFIGDHRNSSTLTGKVSTYLFNILHIKKYQYHFKKKCSIKDSKHYIHYYTYFRECLY